MSLPPVPVRVLTPYERRKRQERWLSLKQAAESGKLTSMDPMEALQQALRQGTATPELIQEVAQAPQPSFVDRFLKALNAAALPFEAFSEGINALVGPMMPQQAFQERSTRSRAVLKAMFGGDMSPAEAAGALRDITRERSMVEQLITGFLFDPLNLLFPGAGAVRAGIKGAAVGGAKAGAEVAAKSLPRGVLSFTLPYVGGKIAGRLQWPTVKELLKEKAGIKLESLTGRRSLGAGGAGTIDEYPEPPRTSPASSQWLPGADPDDLQELYPASRIFYNALLDPEKYAGNKAVNELLAIYQAASNNPYRQALVQIAIDTFGRGFEVGGLRAADFKEGLTRLPTATRAGKRVAAGELSAETKALLTRLTEGASKDAPIFTYRNLGVTPKTKRASLGSPVNTTGVEDLLDELVAKAGVSVPSGKSIRHLMIAYYASLAGPSGATGQAIKILLGHQPGSRDLYQVYQSAVGPVHTKDMVWDQFVTPDFAFKPLETGKAGKARAIEELANIERSAVRATLPPGAPIPRPRKGMGSGPLQRSAEHRLGASKLDHLPFPDANYWMPIISQVPAEDDRRLLYLLVRLVHGGEALDKLDSVYEQAGSVVKGLPRDNPDVTKGAAVRTAVNKERVTLARGIQLRDTILRPNMSRLDDALLDLEKQGLIPADKRARLLAEYKATIEQALRVTKVAEEFRGFAQRAVSSQMLLKLHLTRPETEKWLRFTKFESADWPSQKAAVQDWLDRPEVQHVLAAAGIDLNFPVKGTEGVVTIAMDARGLRNRLNSLIAEGAPARHLLGGDMVKPSGKGAKRGGANAEMRGKRVDQIVAALIGADRIDSTEVRMVKKGQATSGGRVFQTQAEIEAGLSDVPPGPRDRPVTYAWDNPKEWNPRNPDVDAMVDSLIVPVEKVAAVATQDIRPNMKVAQWVANREKTIYDETPKTFGALRRKSALLGKNFLQTVTLKGAATRGVTRLTWGKQKAIEKIEYEAELMRSRLLQVPGIQKLISRSLDPRLPWWEFSDETLPLGAGAFGTRIYQQVKEHLKGFIDIKPSDILRDLIFSEQMSLKELPRVFDLTADEVQAVALLRSLAKRGTVDLVQALGTEEVEKLLGHPASKIYFPGLIARRGAKDFGVESISSYGFMQPGVWGKPRKIRDAIDDWRAGVKRHNPVEAVVHYVADTQRIAADYDLYDLMVSGTKGPAGVGGQAAAVIPALGTKGHAVLQTREDASRTLLGLAQGIKAGRGLEVEARHLAKLLEYKDVAVLKDEMTLSMGHLARGLLDHPERVDDLLPHIEAQVRAAQESVRAATRLHQGTESLPGLADFWFSESVEAKRATEYFQEQNKALNKVLTSANQLSASLRMAQAGVDFSFLSIQGLLALTRHPIMWGKAAWDSVQIWVHPEMMGQIADKHADTIKELIHYGGVWELGHEIFAGMKPVTRVLGAVPGAGPVLRQIPERFEAAFTGYLLNMRLYMWEAMRHTAHGNADQLRALANHINKFTGVYSPAAAGLTQFQRHMEGLTLSFAPMYRRAAIGLIVDAFRGVPGRTARLDVKEAQKAFLALGLAAVTFGGFLKWSGINKDALSPDTPKFMAVPVGDSWVGIGSAYYSITRAAWAVTKQAMDPQERGKLLVLNLRDNALARWWRSQAPPLMSAGIDLYMGQTYTGDPLRGKDGSLTGWSLARWGTKLITPMALESALENVTNPDAAGIAFGEVFGARAFPLSLRDKRRNLANNLLSFETEPEIVAWRAAQERAGKPAFAESMPALLRERLTLRHPDLQSLDKQIEEDTLRRGRDDLKERTLYFQQVQKNKAYLNSEFTRIVAGLMDGSHDERWFRDEVSRMQTASVALSTRTADQFQDVIGWLEERKLERADDPDAFVGDLLYDAYYNSVVFNPETKDANGNFMPKRREKLDADFIERYGLATWDYIQARRKQARQYPSLVQEYLDAVDALKPYWRLHYDLWGDDSVQAELIDDYRALPPRDQSDVLDRDPRLRRYLRTLTKAREKLRRANPEIDWLLAKWFGAVPQTRAAQERLVAWQNQRGLTTF